MLQYVHIQVYRNILGQYVVFEFSFQVEETTV